MGSRLPVWPPVWTSLTLMFPERGGRADRGAAGKRITTGDWRFWRNGVAMRRCVRRCPRSLYPCAKGAFGSRASDRPARPAVSCDFRVLQRVTAMAFNQRRKMLRSSLKALAPGIEALLETVAFRPPRGPRRSGWTASARWPGRWRARRARCGQCLAVGVQIVLRVGGIVEGGVEWISCTIDHIASRGRRRPSSPGTGH